MASSVSTDGDRRMLNKVWQERAKYMLDTGLYADVKVNVKYSDKRVKTFAAHSLYLKWASPVFERMLEGNFKESSYVIEFEHCPEAFQDLMTFIYLDHVDIQSPKVAWELYDIAHKYDIQRLDVLCTDYIENNLNGQSVWLAFIWSKVYNLEKIEVLSHNYIVTKTVEAVASDDFVDLEESMISFLLDGKALNIPEAMLFNYVELWISAELKRKGGNEEQQEEAKSSLIQQLVPKIHFFEMTFQEILDGPNKSNLLSKDQKLSLFTNFQNINSEDQSSLADGLLVFPEKRNRCILNCSCYCPEFYCYKVNETPYCVEFNCDSFVRLSSSIAFDTRNSFLSFNFKTTTPDCLIISCWNDVNNYILIGVENGKLHLEINYGGHGQTKKQSDKCVDDGKPHNISFIFRSTSIDMILDNSIEALTTSDSRYYKHCSYLHIGRNPDIESNGRFKVGFNGCISSLFISSIKRVVDFRTDHQLISNIKVCKCEFK